MQVNLHYRTRDYRTGDFRHRSRVWGGLRLDEKQRKRILNSKTVTLPRLNRLKPSLEGTALKIMEESGELAQAIGKFRGLSGEQQRLEEEEAMQMVARELVDVAQTAVTMMFVLEEQYGIDLEIILSEHIAKLRQKGYCD